MLVSDIGEVEKLAESARYRHQLIIIEIAQHTLQFVPCTLSALPGAFGESSDLLNQF